MAHPVMRQRARTRLEMCFAYRLCWFFSLQKLSGNKDSKSRMAKYRMVEQKKLNQKYLTISICHLRKK